MEEKKKTTVTGLDESTAILLCYLPFLGVLPAVALLIMEKNEKIRWNALQAILLFVTVMIADLILNISVIGRGIVPLVNILGMIVLPLILAIRAYQGEQTSMPVLGSLVDSLLLSAKQVKTSKKDDNRL